MATATEAIKKITFLFTAKYKNKAGEWAETTKETEFSLPDLITDVSVNFVGDDGKQQQVKRDFERFIVHDVSEALSLLESNPYLTIQAINYALDLMYRNAVKGPIATEEEGPGKLLKKMAEQTFASRAKMGKPITMERAFELAKRTLEED